MDGNRDTLVRMLHDVGAAAWFGGTLMGAVGLNGAASAVRTETERAPVASIGWARWAPVNAAAIGAHVVGGVGLLLANRGRVAHQSGTTANTVVKTALTAVGIGLTAYSGMLGAQVAKAGPVPAAGAVRPSAATPSEVAAAMDRLRLVQYAVPAVAGTLIALGAQQGEQQKPEEQRAGFARRARQRLAR
jgi:hypothetical protein